jgi:prevent-host-death family protein
MIINIAEAKAHLSNIIERAYNGEKITIAKNNLPLVDLIPHQQTTKRQLGIAKGLIHYHDDIFTTDQEEIEAFYDSKLEP